MEGRPTVETRYFNYSKDELVARKKAILTKVVSEERSMTARENQEVNSIDRELEKLENRKEEKGMENRDFEKFLLNENQKSFEQRADGVTLMADNESVKANNMANYMVKYLIERCELFGKCQHFSPANGVLAIPRELADNADDSFEFVGENTSLRVDEIGFETVKLEAKRIGVAVKVTEQMLMNSGVDVQAYVVELLSRKLNRAIAKQMVVGQHPSSLQGLQSLSAENDGIHELSVSALDCDGLLDAIHTMHPDHLNGAFFVVNRKTYNAIAKLKDASGQYVLKVERSVANEPTKYRAFGFDVLINDQVADNEVYFANMREAYGAIVPRQVRVKRIADDSVNALNATVVFMVDVYIDAVCKNGKAVVKVNIG